MCATLANSKSVWDDIWAGEQLDTWRTYPGVFGRIEFICKHLPAIEEKTILDVGCGVGVLMHRLHDATKCNVIGIDLSSIAINYVKERGYFGETFDLEENAFYEVFRTHDSYLKHSNKPYPNVLTCTEVVEHLTEPKFHGLLSLTPNFETCFISTPNNCLGPEVESQHLRKLTAIEFLNILRKYRPDWRVECIDRYLVAIAGYPVLSNGERKTTVSFTMPVKNEEKDIERVLKSFRGIADEIVIGVDDKSTDRTEEIARQYADKVFFFTWEEDFSKARNSCIEQCSSEWIFMSEGHEHLKTGIEALLRLNEVPQYISVLEVRRECINTNWYFPWLFRNKPEIRFKNAVHNVLDHADGGKCAQAGQISTYHERSLEKAIERFNQRKGMNKQDLLRRIKENDVLAMFYLANEYRGEPSAFCQRQALHWFNRFIEVSRPGPMRYHARLTLGRMLLNLAKVIAKKREKEREGEIPHLLVQAKHVLVGATEDDPTRTEHWLVLGEICETVGQLDFAMRFYEFAALGIGRIPASYMFVSKDAYSYLPAQKLAVIYVSLGLLEDALVWAKKVEGLLPEHAPPEAITNARENVAFIEEQRNAKQI